MNAAEALAAATDLAECLDAGSGRDEWSGYLRRAGSGFDTWITEILGALVVATGGTPPVYASGSIEDRNGAAGSVSIITEESVVVGSFEQSKEYHRRVETEVHIFPRRTICRVTSQSWGGIPTEETGHFPIGVAAIIELADGPTVHLPTGREYVTGAPAVALADLIPRLAL